MPIAARDQHLIATTSISFTYVFTMSLLMLTVCCLTKTSFSSSKLFVLIAFDFTLQNITSNITQPSIKK